MTDDINLVIEHGEDRCQVLLACGHWSHVMSSRSSAFDFPTDPLHCGNCADNRLMDLRLVRLLLEVNERG